jgi:uncharacterized membrane protein
LSIAAPARAAWIAAVSFLLALLALCVAWELVLAPVKPGGSWLVLKALPLLAPLFGVLHGRRYTFKWTTLLIWFYAAEGAMRTYGDTGLSAWLAAVELVLCLGYYGAAVAYLRATRTA